MSSNYQQKKMMNALGAIDTKGNIVLEQFQDGTALLFQPGSMQPFCVATDYDRATASWSYGKYFSDLGCAHEAADYRGRQRQMGQGGYSGKAQSTGYRTDRIQRAVRHHGRFKALGASSR